MHLILIMLLIVGVVVGWYSGIQYVHWAILGGALYLLITVVGGRFFRDPVHRL